MRYAYDCVEVGSGRQQSFLHCLLLLAFLTAQLFTSRTTFRSKQYRYNKKATAENIRKDSTLKVFYE
jgi:hypothetical protein